VPIADVAAAIRANVEGDRALDSSTVGARRELVELYREEGYVPLWVDPMGRPTSSAREALAMLGGAAADGFNPADYHAARLERLAAQLETARPARVADVAGFERDLSEDVLRYMRDLHAGRVDPRSIGFRMTAPADTHDFAALLRTAIADGRVAEAAADLAPPLALYRGLRLMLARYRTLAADPALEALALHTETLRPDESYAGLRALHHRLVALGDLPPESPVPADYAPYEGGLVEGVRHFQLRHALETDGIVGRNTWAALRVPLAWRVRQIELALERLRWLPHLTQDRLIAVNIPMFHLWAWDSIPPDGAPLFGMGVIVGRALNTRTPVFVEEMRYLIFRPYWNVPPGILRSEVIPGIERDPDYLLKRDMEIVLGPGDDAQPVEASEENLDLLRRRVLRVRQRPGPNNAMGLVKFIFPNDENVYMHGTPAQELFSRTRRDFSHGCVRLEDSVALAEWALKDQPEWTRERILAAMNGSRPQRVNLTRPIQVILFYITAVVMPEDGTIRFADDIYGHDTRLDTALKQRSAAS
jgi:murein L,D-transpeptidase YcbB/YkuD